MAGAKDEYRREHGKEPSDLDLFIYAKQKKSAKPVGKNTMDKIDRLKELKQQLPEELIDDIEKNNEIFEKIMGDEAPKYFRRNHGGSLKKKDLVYVSKQEFDRAVEERCNDKIASMHKEMDVKLSKEIDAKFSKFQDDYLSKMSMLQHLVFTSEDQNIFESSSQEGLMNLEICKGIIRGMRDEIDDHDENNMGIHFDGVNLQVNATSKTSI